MRILTAALCVAMLAACGPSEPLKVSSIQLGKSLNSDDSVGNHATRFKPEDTVYVAALTSAPGSSTITVRWRFSGRTVNEESKEVSYREPAATAFNFRYAGGIPPGQYRVEIDVDGQTAATRDFTVEK